MENVPQTSVSSFGSVTPHSRLEPLRSNPPPDVVVTPSDRRRGHSSPPPAKFRLLNRAASTPPETTNEKSIPRSSTDAGGELASASNLQQSWHHQQLSKKRSQYYDNAFAYREAHNTARGKLVKESLVIAEVKLYCKLEHEQLFLENLSLQLCKIYQRAESSVMVILAPVSMLLGGKTEPAYYITISGLSPEIAPTKNKRSTALLQDWVFDFLRIPLERGVVHFETIAAENLATHGTTLLQEIEEMERCPNEDDGVLRTISRNRGKMGRKSSMPIFTERGKTPTPGLTPGIVSGPKPDLGEITNSKSPHPDGASLSKKMRFAKSIFMAMFGQEREL